MSSATCGLWPQAPVAAHGLNGRNCGRALSLWTGPFVVSTQLCLFGACCCFSLSICPKGIPTCTPRDTHQPTLASHLFFIAKATSAWQGEALPCSGISLLTGALTQQKVSPWEILGRLRDDAEFPGNILPPSQPWGRQALLWLAKLCFMHPHEADIFGNTFVLENTKLRAEEDTILYIHKVSQSWANYLLLTMWKNELSLLKFLGKSQKSEMNGSKRAPTTN